jgi:hypothetical protein
MRTQAEYIRVTSLDAYQDLKQSGKLGEMQQRVCYLIATFPDSTDRELSQLYAEHWGGTDPNSVRPRRHELLEMNVIEESGQRICRISAHMALTWRIKLNSDQPELF